MPLSQEIEITWESDASQASRTHALSAVGLLTKKQVQVISQMADIEGSSFVLNEADRAEVVLSGHRVAIIDIDGDIEIQCDF